MNGLHLLLVALLLHRALVWRDERRDRDLLLGALLGGLCVSNHGLAITVVPIVIVFVLVDARREIARYPSILLQAVVAFAVGLLTPYLYITLRARSGRPRSTAGSSTWDGFFAHVSGAQFRGDMHFLSIESVAGRLGGDAAGRRPPRHRSRTRSSSPSASSGSASSSFATGGSGRCWSCSRLVNVYFYANYMGDLSHYLLTTWLILAIGLAVAAETVAVAFVVASVGPREPVCSSTRSSCCRSCCWPRTGRGTTSPPTTMASGSPREMFAALPQDAVLITYWDALAPLSYKHCIEGVRPDVSLRAYDEEALVTCDPVERPLADVARRRPVYALMVFDQKRARGDHRS